MNRTEAQRLAAAINALRPDWPTKSLLTFVETELHTRSYRDAAVALSWVATDASSRTPKRVLEAGPWWGAGPSSEQPTRRVTTANACRECGRDEHTCRELERKLGDLHGHTYAPLAQPAELDVATGELRPRFDPSELLGELRATWRTPAPAPEPSTTPQGAHA